MNITKKIIYSLIYIIMLTNNQIIKSMYHLFASVFLLHLGFCNNFDDISIKIILIFLGLIHLYDTWWFFNNDGNAPI